MKEAGLKDSILCGSISMPFSERPVIENRPVIVHSWDEGRMGLQRSRMREFWGE